MKNNTTPMRNSLPFTSVLVGAALLSGILMFNQSHTRQYSSGLPVVKEHAEQDALGMQQFFFSARKNITTGNMDYSAMAASNAAVAKMLATATNRTTAGLTMNWNSMGPTNIGGRTRGILIDNLDPTHNTLFACAVSGGIWKSVDGGGTWDSVPGNDQFASMEACCIAQDKNGVIYVGTGEGYSLYYYGEGFSSALLGGGIYKSTDDGLSWTLMPGTIPASSNSPSIKWAYVNRIAIDPNNPLYIYAATNTGLLGTQDGGVTWSTVKSGNCQDVELAKDGTLMLAVVSGFEYYAYPSGFVSTLTLRLPGNIINATSSGRAEFAISPTNSNYAYISINANGNFGIGAVKGTGIYFTMDAKTNGGHWHEIGPGGSSGFDPYSSNGSGDQVNYDNTLAVSPANPGTLLLGGTTIWSWEQTSSTDTVGKWTSLTTYYGGVHPDQHALVFDSKNPNIVYNGNDGGIFKSVNSGTTWFSINRNYNVTQFDALAFSSVMTPPKAGYTVAEGVMGGTQDNGTPYIGGYYPVYYMDAYEVGGGDGGKSAMSQIDPNIYFVTSDNTSLLRGSNLNTLGSPANAYTKTIGDTAGANIDSVSNIPYYPSSPTNLNGGCFYHQIALYENTYDTTTLDMMLWIADTSYLAGTTVYPISPNGNLPFPYKLTTNVSTGDTVKIKNPVISKLAVGFSANDGVWLTMQAADVSQSPIWMPIGGPDSKPDAFSGVASPVHAMAWSPNGDALFVGTENGLLYRFSNLDSIVDNQYTTGALFGMHHNGGKVVNPKCRVISNHLRTFSGRDILSIAVDPQNGNNVMVTLGNYGSAYYVYYSTNALSASPVFDSVQGNLPAMPVYSCVLNVLNSGFSKSALVGTEKGVWSTTNIAVASPSWTYTNTGGANTLVMALGQQTLPPWNCNNSGCVYAGTHGRGAWVSTNFYKPLSVQSVADATEEVGVKVYPNPMTTKGTIEFTLPKNGNVTITVFDLSGKVIKTVDMDNQAKGNHYVDLNAEGYSAGAYIATVTGTDFRKSARFVVVK